MVKREQIQKEAFDAWVKGGRRGTVEMITGIGKTKVSLDAVKELPKDARIIFLAETSQREMDLRKDQIRFECTDYMIHFACYQSAYKWEGEQFDLVIADEIHDSMTPEYSKFFKNNKYDRLMGLTATVDRKVKVSEDEEGNAILKGELVDKYAPVCYSYTMDDGQKDGTSRSLVIHEIRHNLDIKNKNIEAGSAKKKFFQTEFAAYQYKDKMFKQACWMSEADKVWAIPRFSRLRATLLYSLPSKIKAVKACMEVIEGQTILFGNHIDSLLQITPNVMSSRNTPKKNDKLRTDFDKGKIDTIGSFKMLKQGANLVGLENCFIHSYYSTQKDTIQRVGRLRNDGTVGNVFIMVTNNTQEEVWYRKMLENNSTIPVVRYKDYKEFIQNYKTK